MRIAVAQTPGAGLNQWRETLALVDELVRQAAGAGAELVVLPECVWPAYWLGSEAIYRAARAAGLPGPDAFLARLRQSARQRNIAICAGYVEEQDQRLFNAASLIDATGEILGTHRKCFLWDFDHEYFQAGQTIEPVNADFGRVGVMICADARLPEIPATLAARGASLFVQPTGWVNAGGPDEPWNPQPDFLIPARAAEFGVPIASASKWGVEGSTTFVGSSLICDAEGNVLVQCGQKETKVVVADVQPAAPRPPRLTPSQRKVLSERDTSTRPSSRVPPLNVVLLPAPVDRALLPEQLRYVASRFGGGEVLCLGPLAGSGVQSGADVATRRLACILGPTEGVISLGSARLAAVSDSDARTFGSPRCLALQGAHLIVVFGDEIAEGVVRTRACENRVFVAWAGRAGVTFIEPSGRVPTVIPWPRDLAASSGVEFDLQLSVNKEVSRGTDVFACRRPECYSF